MTRRVAICLLNVIFGGIALRSQAVTVSFTTGPGLSQVISDNAYNGTLASMAQVSIPVGPSLPIQSISTTIGLDHTWVGDLVIKLLSPNGTVCTLVSRPGLFESADDGTSAPGDDSNLSKLFPITFVSGAAVSAESMGSTLTDNQVIGRDDGIVNFKPDHGAAAAGDLSSFNGQTSSGTWKVLVGDAGSGDVGTIDMAKLTMNLITQSGDYDLDGDVDANDYSTWRATFGSTMNLAADGNNNSIVDAADYAVWRDHFRQTAGSDAGAIGNVVVPEPTTLVLLTIAAIGKYLWRGRSP